MAMGRSRCTWACCPDLGSHSSLDTCTLASSLALLDHYGAGTQVIEVDLSLVPSIFQSPAAQLPPEHNFLSSVLPLGLLCFSFAESTFHSFLEM